MTAFASHELNQNNITVAAEIRCINSRHLDLVLRLSSGYAALEEKIKHQINAAVIRGRVEARIQIKDQSEPTASYEVDWERAQAYMVVVEQLKTTFHLPPSLTVEQLAAVPGVVQSVERTFDAEKYWPMISLCLQIVLADLDRMRSTEGDFILKDFSARLAFIESGLTQIEAATQGMLSAYQQKLTARIEALTQGALELDPVRIAQEAAFLADRSDISEETVRARSHIEQFRTMLNSDEPAGRKLNFLLQELNREFNTMGAKVGQAAIAHVIVDIKAELEKLREQIQNIE
jgi:uncharacterized protein (TIGR00255 family)